MLASLCMAVSRGFLSSALPRAPLARGFTASRPARGMEEFFAQPLPEGRAPQRAGRAWLASELRLKCFDDLHKLWFVCLKERNYLLTERLYYRQMLQAAPEAERLRKVKKTMAAIKVVIGERARAAQALEEDLERERKVKAVAGALTGTLEGALAGAGAGAAAGSKGGKAAAAAAAPATPASARAARRSGLEDTEEEKARAALARRKELLHVRGPCRAWAAALRIPPPAWADTPSFHTHTHPFTHTLQVPVTFKRFGRKYTVSEQHPAPASPTRAERARADRTRRYFARAQKLQAAAPTLPQSKSFAFATTGSSAM